MRDTWDKQQTDPDYYFDTRVPPIAGAKKQLPVDNALETSIGDLAPKGLQ